ILGQTIERGVLMAVVTGELIRAMNYVEDITATLRRGCIYSPGMSADERKRLAESLRGTVPAVSAAIADLEKGENWVSGVQTLPVLGAGIMGRGSAPAAAPC